MFRYLFRQKNTRGPVLGIIVITVFIALGASLLVSVNNRGGGDAEAGADSNLPNVVDQVEDRDRYSIVVENQTINIDAVSPNERMRIVLAAPEPVVEAPAEEQAAKQEQPTPTPTQVPVPQNPEVILAPTETSFGVAADGNPTPTPTPIPATVQPTNVTVVTNNLIAYVNHTVSAGETIYRLTQLYNTSVTMLSEAGISEYDMQPGNVLSIPYANNAACSTGKAYPIREGDTLFRIGVNKGTTAVAIQQANGIDANYSIDAGSALCLP